MKLRRLQRSLRSQLSRDQWLIITVARRHNGRDGSLVEQIIGEVKQRLVKVLSYLVFPDVYEDSRNARGETHRILDIKVL